jgi:hypothetical protein
MDLAVGDLLGIDVVAFGDSVAEATLISLVASGIVPTTEEIGIPRYDCTMGLEADEVERWVLDR